MNVFIADDSDVVRERLASSLSEIADIVVVGEAEDGIDATNSIQQLNPDLVILDIRMPGRSGIEVLKTIKRSNPNIVVMMLTSYPYPQYRRKCLAEGAGYFFDKATQMNEAISVVKYLAA